MVTSSHIFIFLKPPPLLFPTNIKAFSFVVLLHISDIFEVAPSGVALYVSFVNQIPPEFVSPFTIKFLFVEKPSDLSANNDVYAGLLSSCHPIYDFLSPLFVLKLIKPAIFAFEPTFCTDSSLVAKTSCANMLHVVNDVLPLSKLVPLIYILFEVKRLN